MVKQIFSVHCLEFKMQTRLMKIKKLKFIYPKEQINYIKKGVQKIETHRGCPNACPYCFEPKLSKQFEIPKILSNKVEILDMNFLSQKNALSRLNKLGAMKHNRRMIKYELVCGIDYRFLTPDLANALYDNRFGVFTPKTGDFIRGIRLAWDWDFKEQYKIHDAIRLLRKAGFQARYITVFMLSNWHIKRDVCERKLDLLKIWNVKVANCIYRSKLFQKNYIPEHWSEKDIEEFKAKCRKHNHLINFRIDPEVKA